MNRPMMCLDKDLVSDAVLNEGPIEEMRPKAIRGEVVPKVQKKTAQRSTGCTRSNWSKLSQMNILPG